MRFRNKDLMFSVTSKRILNYLTTRVRLTMWLRHVERTEYVIEKVSKDRPQKKCVNIAEATIKADKEHVENWFYYVF